MAVAIVKSTQPECECDHLVRFIGTKGINPFVRPELAEVIRTAISTYSDNVLDCAYYLAAGFPE